MSIQENGRRKLAIIISLVLAGEAIFLLPFVLARIFRPTLLQVFEITNLELGTAFSVYGIVAMASYFFGGPLADRFPARNLMATALWATALGGVVMAMQPSITILILLYGYWGLTTIFLFWAAMIRATREWGGAGFQGRAFGLLEGGRGLTAALIGSLALAIFSYFILDLSDNPVVEQRNASFQIVVLSTSVFIALIGILVWVYIPGKNATDNIARDKFSLNRVIEVLKMPVVWMQGIIIICAYVGYKSTDDFSLYANQVLGFDEVKSAGVGALALWMRPVFAILAGFLADRFKGVNVIIYAFIMMLLGSVLIFLGVLEKMTGLTLVVLSSTLVGVYGIRGIYFAVMQESGIPLSATGTAVGIMSVLGYTPDVFMSPLMGFLLDSFPGATGHQYVFLVLAIAATIGLLVSIIFKKMIKS